jgi:hypothetical protein
MMTSETIIPGKEEELKENGVTLPNIISRHQSES